MNTSHTVQSSKGQESAYLSMSKLSGREGRGREFLVFSG